MTCARPVEEVRSKMVASKRCLSKTSNTFDTEENKTAAGNAFTPEIDKKDVLIENVTQKETVIEDATKDNDV